MKTLPIAGRLVGLVAVGCSPTKAPAKYLFTIAYYDAGLMETYRNEQRAKDQENDKKKKAALSHDL